MGINKLLILLTVFNVYHKCNALWGGSMSESGYNCPFDFLPMPFKLEPTLPMRTFCGRQMGLATFYEKNQECLRNSLPSEFYKTPIPSVNTSLLYWTDFKREYENGPFINQNILDSNFGKIQDFTEDDPIDGTAMCAVANFTSGKLHAVSCDSEYNYICVVDVNVSRGNTLTDQFCSSSIPFKTPFITCLKKFENTSATSLEARSLCEKDFGHLVQRGCIYLNYDEFQPKTKEYPIGIKGSYGKPQWLTQDNRPYYELPDGNWEDIDEFSSVSFKNAKFTVKNADYLFSSVVCEYDFNYPVFKMILTSKSNLILSRSSNGGYNNRLVLELNGDWNNVAESDIACFTDSETYHSTRVSINISAQSNREFFLSGAKHDGYYWCIAINIVSIQRPKSNKVLFHPNLTPPKDLKAFLIQFPKGMQREDINASVETEFLSPIYKRVYKNNTVLIHSTRRLINKSLMLFERSLQHCAGFKKIKSTDIGKSAVDTSSPDIVKYYTCKGDFNVGAFWEEVEEYSTTENYETSTDATENSTEDWIDYTVQQENSSGDYSTEFSTTENDLYLSTPMYSEKIEEVIDNIKSMLGTPVNLDNFEDTVKEVNSVLLLKDANIPQALTKNFDDLLNTVEIPMEQTYIKIIQSNIAVLVAKRDGPAPVVGIKVERIGNGPITDNTIHGLTEADMLDADMYDSNNDIVVKLPSNLCHGVSGKLSFTLFKDDAAFPKENNSDWEVNSRVLSISLDNKTCFKKSDYVDIYFMPYDSQQCNKKKACAYWDFDHGNWSTNICILLPSEKLRPLDICRCYHMTHFAQIIRYHDIESETEHKTILSGITYVGCTLSLIGLLIICLTGIISQTWRSEFSNQVWLNLSSSIGVLIISFLTISILDFSLYDPLVCIATGVVLHFALLSSFSWMFLAAFMSYRKIKRVFSDDSPYRLLRACVFGWVLPVIPIAILLSVDSDSYLLHYKQGQSEMDFCYPSGLGYWLTVFSPVAFVVFANTVLFVLIIYNIFKRTKITSHGGNNQMARRVSMSFLMFFLYGLTWMFGLFSNNVYVSYVFCFTATAQGFILFVFFIIVNKKTRNIWRRHLGGKPNKLTPTDTSKADKTRSGPSYESHEVVELTKYSNSAFD